MKLSFVIPAYNEETQLPKCLDSIFHELRGTPYDAEIIVVNNASTDHTREVAQKYPGVVVVDEPKKGLVQARHAGFTRSTGDLIANVDADTMLTPGWIDTVFAEFSTHPRLVCLSGPFIYYDLTRFERTLVAIFYFLGFVIYLVNHYVFRISAMVQGGNFVVRREALEAIGGFDTRIRFYGEDTDIARRLAKAGHVKWTFALPIRTSGRRLRAEGILTTGLRYAINFFWVSFFKKPFSETYTDVRKKKP